MKGSARASGDVTADSVVRAARIGDKTRRRIYEPKVVKRIRGLQVTAAEIHVSVTMDLIAAGLGYSIDDQSAGLSVFRVVIVGENLEFLDFVHRRTQSVTPGN